MLVRSVLAAVAVALSIGPANAQQQKPQNTQKTQKAKQPSKAKPVATGPKVRHQCKVGPYEKQTRLVMETVRDKPVYLAYWSSNGPFHCSFESWPGDGRARWIDSSAGMVINLIGGTMLIEKTKDRFLIHARDVERMPYCGTEGLINGVLTVPLRKGACNWKETDVEEAGRLNPPEAPSPPPAAPEVGPSASTLNLQPH